MVRGAFCVRTLAAAAVELMPSTPLAPSARMAITFKPLADQVMVITGASSGIGLTTAEMAAERGAAVVLAGRSQNELNEAVTRIRAKGGRATAVTADVTDQQQVDGIAQAAMREYGRIDTWINNAGIGLYGRLIDQPIAEKRQSFETNFWSVVYGCRAAVRQMRNREAGLIINVGSEVSDRAAPMLGIYSAAKHAVRAYTDTLRMELEHDGIPIWLSLVKPGPIDTPFPQHAANYMDREPKHQPPVYPPEEVAHAILKCAERPIRDVVIGGVPRLQLAMAAVAPRLTDLMMERQMFDGMRSERPNDGRDSLRAPSGEDYGRRRGHQPGRAMSLYTRAAVSDLMRAVPLLAVGAAVAVATAVARRA
jgi:short-subunit dehydrogenase